MVREALCFACFNREDSFVGVFGNRTAEIVSNVGGFGFVSEDWISKSLTCSVFIACTLVCVYVCLQVRWFVVALGGI